MQQTVIGVSVVGFSDVERHALNTIFRLSQERDLTYAPWMPLSAPGVTPPLGEAPVLLVDGDSAEAVMVQVRETLPPGQRLIWIGDDPPHHAWRVQQRPIDWAALLQDLDAVFAAHRVDSGLLDLDITEPAPLGPGLDLDLSGVIVVARRALVVGASADEAVYLKTRLALAAVPAMDVAHDMATAHALITDHQYCCGIFNLDAAGLDSWGLIGHFVRSQPQALTLAVSELAGPLGGWWRRRRLRRDAARHGIGALLPRPLQPPEVSRWLDLL